MSNATNDLIEVKLASPDDFLKVKETLTRIGVASKKDKTLYQSCHILHKRDTTTKESRYYIVHFKELFKLDGKPTTITEEDLARRNTIANILAEWGLVSLVDKQKSATPVSPISSIKIVAYKDKTNWKLEPKYNIGANKKTNQVSVPTIKT
jgi:hypothetical protein